MNDSRTAKTRPPTTATLLVLALAAAPWLAAGEADAQAPAYDLGIAKSDSEDPAYLGQDLTYVLNVTNHGSATSEYANLTDQLPANVTFVGYVYGSGAGSCGVNATNVFRCTIYALEPGESAVLAITVRPHAPGLITNRANVSAPHDADPTNDEDSEDTLVLEREMLTVTKDDAPDPVVVGGNLTYFVNVTNNLNVTSERVWLNDTLPENVTLEGYAVDQGSCAQTSGGLACDLGALDANETVHLRVWVTPTATGNLTNEAVAETAGCRLLLFRLVDPTCSESATERTLVVEPVETADLVLTKGDSPDPVRVDGNLTYYVNVSNVGNVTSGNATLYDELPEEVTFVGYDVVYEHTIGDCALQANNTLVCSVGPLEPGETARFRIFVRPESAGPIVNRARVSVAGVDDPTPADNEDEERTNVTAAPVDRTPAPSTLTCEATADGNLLDWSPSAGATGYRIYRQVDGGPFAQLTLVSAAATSYQDRNVSEGTQYAYRVTATGPGGESAPSPVCELTAIPFFPWLIGGAVAVVGAAGAYGVYRLRRR